MSDSTHSKKPSARVLLVDDEPAALTGMQKLLSMDGYAIETAPNAERALEVMEEHPVDVVVTDMKMPGMTGVEMMKKIHEKTPDVPVIVVTAFGEVATAVNAMREGAEDYLTKPVDFDALTFILARALRRRDLRTEAEQLRRRLREREGLGLEGMIGTSAAMQKVYRSAEQVAPSRATVLVTGESGTGKGELARAIHARSPRASKPLVSVHCSALVDNLLESELFGHERGAFTGADKRRIGRFEQANGGTLFLDEIGEVSPATQVKLLRVLQERTFERVGGNESISVDVRLIAATNRDLAADVGAGRFREDLYYRLNVVQIEMPPLRTRNGDVLLLANHFLHKFSSENGKSIAGFSDRARAKLLEYGWPGNVRELENTMERAVVLCDGTTIEEEHLPVHGSPARRTGTAVLAGMKMSEIEKQAILQTLETVGGSTTKAAEMLGVSVRMIQYRLHEYGVAKGREPRDMHAPHH